MSTNIEKLLLDALEIFPELLKNVEIEELSGNQQSANLARSALKKFTAKVNTAFSTNYFELTAEQITVLPQSVRNSYFNAQNRYNKYQASLNKNLHVEEKKIQDFCDECRGALHRICLLEAQHSRYILILEKESKGEVDCRSRYKFHHETLIGLIEDFPRNVDECNLDTYLGYIEEAEDILSD
jgi:hypothetical protein